MNHLYGKRVLVTGGTGFVGANLTRELIRQGACVHVLVRPDSRMWRIEEVVPSLALHRVDITHRGALQEVVDEAVPEIVFHLAVSRESSTAQDRSATLQTNVLGTLNLLETAAASGSCRFVNVGSSLEYGVRKRALKESDRLEPKTFYATAKAMSTLLCQQFARAFGQSIVTLRVFSVYGYWEGPTRLIPTVIMAALCGREIDLTVPGFRRDLVFVEDVVDACMRAAQAEKGAGEIINVGSGRQWTNEQVVEIVESVTGVQIRTRVGAYDARPTDTTCWLADNRKAERLLKWKPAHTLPTGLEKAVTWFRAHQKLYA